MIQIHRYLLTDFRKFRLISGLVANSSRSEVYFARVTDLVKSPDPTRVTFSKRNVTNEVSGTAFNF